METLTSSHTINRGAQILTALSEGYNRLEDIYVKVGLSKSTTHRLLRVLVSSGFAFQNPLNRNYYMGPLIVKLSSNLSASHQMLILCSLEELRKLRDITRETALLVIPAGDQRMVLKEIPSEQSISFTFGEGRTMPIYGGSSGKVLLSQYSTDDLNRILDQVDLSSANTGFVIDRTILRNSIDETREKGFAITTGEVLIEGCGISVPIEGYLCPAALSIIGPKGRFKPMAILDELRNASARISDKLKNI